MASSPKWKVYDKDGNYQGAVKESVAAACLVSLYSTGATVRWGHAKKDIVWTEGSEDIWAGNSYDIAAEQMRIRANGLVAKNRR